MLMKMQIDGKIFSHEKIGRTASCYPGETYVIFSIEKASACSTEITGGFRQRFLTGRKQKSNYATDKTREWLRKR